jgi:O-antigen/teichoic acid export membrane protein
MSGSGETASNGTPRILRNASLLLGAQVLAAPVAVAVNAVAARQLGPAQFGLFYQALTFASFVFLFVEWGQPGVLTGQVAAHRGRAGELLGSGLAFRVGAALLAGLLAPGIAWLAGYSGEFIGVLGLALLGCLCGTVAGACQDVYRGYERIDFAAASLVGWQLLSAAAVIPTLLAGGGLHGLMIAQVSCAAFGAAFVLWMAPRMQVPPLVVRAETVRELVRRGHPFLVFSLVLALQPMIDAALLSWLGSAEELGWYGVARKLTGVLVFPATALLAALYPALCRLRMEDMDAFRDTAAGALHAVAVVAVPLALGCLLFPELGVAIFGREGFAAAEDNLRVLAPWLLLAYFSMPLGSCLTAAGRQGAWTLVLLAGVLTSAALDPLLIRWYQQHGANGGLGVCMAALVGEIVTLTGALWLLPGGILSRLPRRRLLAVLLSGVVMAAVAMATPALPALVRAVLAMLAYALCLQLAGGANLLQLRAFLGSLRR